MEQTLHINFTQFNSLIALVDYFNTEAKCKAAIAQQRWMMAKQYALTVVYPHLLLH